MSYDDIDEILDELEEYGYDTDEVDDYDVDDLMFYL